MGWQLDLLSMWVGIAITLIIAGLVTIFNDGRDK